MTLSDFRRRSIRVAVTLMVGASTFQLSGCDPAVRNTLLQGLETTTNGLTGALISAFFLGLQDDETTTGGGGLTTT